MTFAGVVKRINHPDKVVAGEFWGPMLGEDIQVKEGEALRQTDLAHDDIGAPTGGKR